MFRRTFLGFISAIMLIAAVVLSGCGASDPMLGKWIAPIPGNSQLGALVVNIEKNGDDQKTRVVTVSNYGYENKTTYENRNKGELFMVWQKIKNTESRDIYPCSNNIIQIPFGTIAYDQNKKCLISGGVELKKADEKGVKEVQATIQKRVNDNFVGNRVTMPDTPWKYSSAYLVKTVIFKDAGSKNNTSVSANGNNQNSNNSSADETVAACTVSAKMVERDVCDYTCKFAGGKTYNFKARIGLKGAFSWHVLSGNEPACFRSSRDNENDARKKLYEAALKAGYQPNFSK